MFFGTVAGHETVLLQQRKVYVLFEPGEIMGLNPKDAPPYTVVEVDVHFDVCIRMLSNLQSYPSHQLPFKECILNLQKEVKPPAYAMDVSLEYCVDPVLCKNSSLETPNEKGIASSENCSCSGDKLQIHEESIWSRFDFELDESQKVALKAALTQELTVIRGSPGTGKTHVGLKLVQILLHNNQIWNRECNPTPIVILSHSNHSLDTFLDRILTTTKKICRIGGKTKSKSLIDYNLKRQTTTANGQFLTRNKRDIGSKLKEISQKMSDIDNKKRRSKCELLPVQDLLEIIGNNDLERLSENYPTEVSSSGNLETLLRSWLEIDELSQRVHNHNQEDTCKQKINPYANTNRVERENFQDLKHVQDANFFHDQRVVDGEFNDLTAMFINESNGRGQKVSQYKKNLSYDREDIQNICQMLNVVPMTPAQSSFCRNLWNLSLEDRWSLYCFWLHRCNEKYTKELQDCRHEHEEQLSKLKANREKVQIEILRNVQVLGITTTGAAKYNELIKQLKPKIIVVDNANQILDCEILFVLNEKTEHLILMGDQQISTSITGGISRELPCLFHQLCQSGFPSCDLQIQYNARPCISDLLVSASCRRLVNHPRVLEYENIIGLEKNLFFFTHSVEETGSNTDTCYINEHEVKFIVELTRYILLQGHLSSSITILTPSIAQFFLFQKRMVGNLQGVKVSVADNFQEDSDIILVSFVRCETECEADTSKGNYLLYTALTRAKKGLYCVGNFEALANQNMFWKHLCEDLKKKNCYGPKLNIKCQTHETVVPVQTPRDIVRLGDGGCGNPCKFCMPCGHECPRKCHPNDRAHKFSKCMEQCQVILCHENHKCQKLCWEVCGNCPEVLDNLLLRCGHHTEAQCFRVSLDQNCYWKVPYKVDNSLYDKKEITIGFAVKFSVNSTDYPCYPSLEQECKVPCGKELECGHTCTGKCGECMGGRIHVPCLETCGKIQLCGHKCLYPCASPCPPCSFQYENECSHRRWTVFCGFPTTQCLKPCSWSCEHLQCSRMCHEPCDRRPCNEPCKKILKCGHSCIGMCGEPCPNLCLFCDWVELRTMIVGNEIDLRTRFMQLEDCGHVVEINAFSNWVSRETSNRLAISLIKCPICLKPIIKNKRFSNFFKYQLLKIEELKSKKYEMMCNISEVKHLLSEVKGQLKMLTQRNETHERFWAKEQSCTDPCSILETIYARLSLKYSPIDLGTLTLFYNYYTFVVENYKIVSKMEKVQDLVGVEFVGRVARKICDFVGYTLESINERIIYFWEFGSEQFIQEIASELRRLHLACNFVLSYQNFFASDNAHIQGRLEHIVGVLVQNLPFRKHEEGMFSLLLAEIQMLGPGTVMPSNVAEPPIPVVEAMDMPEGLWHQCPSGHLFSLKLSKGDMINDCETCVSMTRENQVPS